MERQGEVKNERKQKNLRREVTSETRVQM